MKRKIIIIVAGIMALLTVIVVVLSIILANSTNSSSVELTSITYNEFNEKIENEKIQTVYYDVENEVFYCKENDSTYYSVPNPRVDEFKYELLKKNIEVQEGSIDNGTFTPAINGGKNDKDGVNVFSIVQFVLTTLLILSIAKTIMPKTENKEVTDIPRINFTNIAGQNELKKDLKFVIEYLKNPQKYATIGARMPKGIILHGPPGTGKTLTAKAIAGTAGVPFFSVSGSDFVEMYVGLGAKRVRDLYKRAKKKAPCIVFIDEIDAIGSARDARMQHSENNQTINAFLSALDGFSGNEGILTICATNRLEDLDPALIRPGRFDKQLAVPLPEREDRLEILDIYRKNKNFDENIDWNEVASMTIGFSGASIEAMLNEAAIIAVNSDKDKIYFEDIDRAFYKIIMKGDKKDNQDSRDKKELKIVAWHESGHVLATKLYTNDSVPKVTITASTSGAGGVTFRTPEEMSLHSKEYIEGLIKVMYAGRAAEEAFFGDENKVTTGASDDIKKATELIIDYIGRYGMSSEYGLLNISAIEGSGEQVLKTASVLAKKLYSEVESDMIQHKALIENMANQLIAKESLTEKEINAIFNEDICAKL